MKIKRSFIKLSKTAYLVMSLAFSSALILPMWVETALASPVELTSRSIEMSDSGASGGAIASGVGSGTSVDYAFGFHATDAAKAVAVSFCSDSPLYTDTCTAPTGMDVSSATINTGVGLGTTWTVHAGATASHFEIDDATGYSGSSDVTFEMDGITNPSTLGTFYARIYTYNTDPSDWTNDTTTPGTVVDFGGVALSTANIVTITAKVQETLTFCVSGSDLTTSDCGSATAPDVTLGHNGGSGPLVIDSSTVDDNHSTTPTWTQLSTNATTGAVVRMRASNTSCTNGGLSDDGGTTCGIPGTGATSAAAIQDGATSGNAAFGLFVSDGSLSSGGVGASAAAPAYNDGTHTSAGNYYYGMPPATVSTYGSPLFETDATYGGSPAACSKVNNQLVFAATAAITTPAGIYSGDETLIATGTF
jgi:hypothetical protein